MNLLGASWKPKVVAILALIGPTGLYFVLTAFQMDDLTATKISGGVFALLGFFGFYVAKQDNVSNSPTPLAAAQAVVPVTAPVPVAVPAVLAHPVVVAPVVPVPNTLPPA